MGLYAEYKGLELVPSADTRLIMAFDTAYEAAALYRETDGSGYRPPVEGVFLGSGEAGYYRMNMNWRLGIRQDVLYSERTEKNLISFFMLYRGRYDLNIDNGSLLFQSNLADREVIFQNSVTPGILLDLVSRNAPGIARRGFKAEGSIEMAPVFFFNTEIGRVDFTRCNLDLQFFSAVEGIRLFDPDFPLDLLFSSRFLFDYLYGKEIPINARQSIGGTELKRAVGGVLRGVHEGRFDATIKSVTNLDLRLNMPPIAFLVPGILVYFDSAVHDDLTGIFALDPDRLLFSTGGGIVLNLFGIDINFRLPDLGGLSVDDSLEVFT